MKEKIKARKDKLKKDILTIYYAYQDAATGIFPKIVIFIALSYALSPIDLIPDFIPVLGYLDDLIIIPLLVTLSLKLIPYSDLVNARKKAETEPIALKMKWLFAIIFIIIWALIIILILKISIKYIYSK